MLSALPASETTLIGNSPRTRQLQRTIEKMGQARWPVLILGETGTGKEVVARSIHAQNPIGPFVTIDCSAMVGTLMESELFGYAKGAFTGAVGSKMGLIEAANGGTAFLDEIGELPLDLQAKLLRVLQEKEFRPVGSLQARRSDFRVIAATNRDLTREVERGTFRRDLYYRLNVVSVRLAPLRERKDDVVMLAKHFLQMYGHGHQLTQETLDVMTSYDWPGNVRELENSIQHMVAINSGPLLTVNALPSAIQNHLYATRPASFSMAAGNSGAASIGGSTSSIAPMEPVRAASPSRGFDVPLLPLVELERRAIMHALEHTKGDRGVAATLLGIGRTTLYRKLKEYQLAPEFC